LAVKPKYDGTVDVTIDKRGAYHRWYCIVKLHLFLSHTDSGSKSGVYCRDTITSYLAFIIRYLFFNLFLNEI
jgi:hypothetical protein